MVDCRIPIPVSPEMCAAWIEANGAIIALGEALREWPLKCAIAQALFGWIDG